VSYSDFTEILKRGVLLATASRGAFDFTIRPIAELWNIGQDDARVPSEQEIADALPSVDYHNVLIDESDISLANGASIDLGGIAKGYAADKIAELFKSKGVKDALIGLSGNIYALGKNEDGEDWQIGLQDPLLETSYIGVLAISDTSVVTSGAYERFAEIDGVRYGHIFDPKSGIPVDNDLLSVSIISADSTLADAYSTALFVMGLDAALQFHAKRGATDKFEAIFVTKDKRIICTPGILDRFKIADETGRYKPTE
jgi:thiamine biosynthesis lipoprotein